MHPSFYTYVQVWPYLDARPILTSNTKCPFKSKQLLPIFNNKVRIKVSVIFSFGLMQQLIFTFNPLASKPA